MMDRSRRKMLKAVHNKMYDKYKWYTATYVTRNLHDIASNKLSASTQWQSIRNKNKNQNKQTNRKELIFYLAVFNCIVH